MTGPTIHRALASQKPSRRCAEPPPLRVYRCSNTMVRRTTQQRGSQSRETENFYCSAQDGRSIANARFALSMYVTRLCRCTTPLYLRYTRYSITSSSRNSKVTPFYRATEKRKSVIIDFVGQTTIDESRLPGNEPRYLSYKDF